MVKTSFDHSKEWLDRPEWPEPRGIRLRLALITRNRGAERGEQRVTPIAKREVARSGEDQMNDHVDEIAYRKRRLTGALDCDDCISRAAGLVMCI